MKKKSTSQSAFFNPRAVIGLFVCLTGVLIAFFAFGVQPTTPQANQPASSDAPFQNPITRQELVGLYGPIVVTAFQPPACVAGSEMFHDVPASSGFCAWIEELARRGITGGCGGGNYCPNDPVTRQQMAVFLLKGKHGLCYVPPACTPGFFADVACPSTYANWIEALANEGITGGCGGGNYCPTNPVRRDQMAVFLLKAEHGSSYTPPACTGVFTDVPCPGTFTNWIEELYHENIAAGCGSGNYCPSNPNNRGQMAVFITKTFNLP